MSEPTKLYPHSTSLTRTTYHISHLLAWGNSLEWGDLPSRPLAAFRRFTGVNVRGDKAAKRLIARYFTLQRHPNRQLIKSIDFVDGIISGKIQI